MHIFRTSAALFAVCFCCNLHGQTVVLNENIRFLRPSPHFPDYNVSAVVYKYPEGAASAFCAIDCKTFVGFEYSNGIFSSRDTTLDIGSDWYLTQPGDVFSAATVAAGLYPVLLDMSSSTIHLNTVDVDAGDFYLGVRTSTGYGPNPRHRTAYGWVHLRPVDGVLTMVENAMSYDSQGIIVGTTTVVPEPHAVALVLAMVTLPIVFGRFRLGRSVPESAN